MFFTEGQDRAMKAISRLKDSWIGRPQICVIAGFAGTGKTTLERHIPEAVGPIFVITPTGKAGLRVRQATGLHDVGTLHSWMYKPVEADDLKKGRGEGVYFILRELETIQRPSSGVIVIDEASMVTQKDWESIYETCCALDLNIVVIGDGFQLPPISLDPDEVPFSVFSPNFQYDVRIDLTEIKRSDDLIIRVSLALRENNLEALWDLPHILDKNEFFEKANEIEKAAGVTICYSNKLRQKINQTIRQKRGLPKGAIVAGEPLMVLRNSKEVGVFNGEVVNPHRIGSVYEGSVIDNYAQTKARLRYGILTDSTNPFDETARERDYVVCLDQIEDDLKGIGSWSMEKNSGVIVPGRYPFIHANYGYAFTAHKAQGSEWDDVLVAVDQGMNLYHIDGRRWLYTAITRAKKTATLYR